MLIEQEIVKLLVQKHKTLAIAESCTGGLVSHKITNISGSSQYFKLGIVAYSNQAKTNLLKISENLIKAKGAVSKEVALLMAKNIRRIAKADFGIGITGIAGPTGATKTKPVGLVFIALSSNNKSFVKKFSFKGSRRSIKSQAVDSALKLLEEYIK